MLQDILIDYLYKFYSYLPGEDIRLLVIVYQLSTLYPERYVFVMRNTSTDSLEDIQIGDHSMIAIQHNIEYLE